MKFRLRLKASSGEMAERLKAPASKAGRDLRPSRVQISLSPPESFRSGGLFYGNKFNMSILRRDGRVVEGARLERV